MTKTQKVLLWVGLGLFMVPELFWATISNIIYEFSHNSSNTLPYRPNYFTVSDHITALNIVLVIQALGVVLVFLLILRAKYKDWRFLPVHIILFFITVSTLWFCYISITLGRHGW